MCSECARKGHEFQNFNQLLELIFEDDRASVHAGEVNVRPPPAPTVASLPGRVYGLLDPWRLLVTYPWATAGGGKAFEKGDGTVEQRLDACYSEMKHIVRCERVHGTVGQPPAARLSIRPRVSPFFLPANSLLLLNRGCRSPRRSGARNERAELHSILDLRPSNGDMGPVSNRNCRASVANAVVPATCHRIAIHTEMP
jgi:hypothetical protein